MELCGYLAVAYGYLLGLLLLCETCYGKGLAVYSNAVLCTKAVCGGIECKIGNALVNDLVGKTCCKSGVDAKLIAYVEKGVEEISACLADFQFLTCACLGCLMRSMRR